MSSCFLVSVPVKAIGEILEKSANATGKAMKRGFHKVTQPDGSTKNSGDDWNDDASVDYDEDDLEHLPPLLPRR